MKKCPKCGKESDGAYCFACGTPLNQDTEPNNNIPDPPPPKKDWIEHPIAIILFLIFLFPVGLVLMYKYTNWSTSTKAAVTAFIGVLVIFGLVIVCSSGEETATTMANTSTSNTTSYSYSSTPSYSYSSSPSSSTTLSSAPLGQHYEVTVGAGNYAAGIDIPVGTYNITAISGGGNIFSTTGLNEIMGVDGGIYIPTYNNAKLGSRSILEISGDLTVKLVSENAQVSSVTARPPSGGNPITLSSGEYTAGVDFPVGIYNVTWVKGNGNVISSSGLNEIMGTYDGYIKQYNNAVFLSGSTLELSGVTVTLTPVQLG